MSNIRKRASKFFRIKSSSASISDIPTVGSSFDRQRPNRSISLPVNNTNGTPEDNPPTTHSLQPSDTPTVELSLIVTPKSLVDSPTPMPTTVAAVLDSATGTANGDVVALKGLAPIVDKASSVIQKEAIAAAERAEREDEIRILKAFDDTLQLKSTATNIMSQLKSGISEDPWFMRALDDVAKMHTFAAAAILVFKAVYKLEMTRRQNDKRIIALYKEMKDMIEVLTRLRDIKDPEVIGPNGTTIKGKMQSIVNDAAQDIKDCANACDTWMKKKILLKVLVGPAWEGKLAGFSSAFNMRRMQFEFALTIHTAGAVDQIQVVTQAMNAKLSTLTDHFIQAFSQLRPPEEVQWAAKVEARGGVQAVRTNEAALRELFEPLKKASRSEEGAAQAQDGDGTKHQRSANRNAQKSEYTFDDLKGELREDVDTSLKNNFKAFEGKFQLFYDQLETNLHKYMREESDRVISEVNKGPHDLIRDPELKVIWKEMHWRRNVKARPFVMTLRDHFTDKAELSTSSTSDDKDGHSRSDHDKDGWTRQYIDIKYLQPIMDAIDDDGSGHVTLAEINRFTELLPASLGWSLTHWLAYWAIGWQTFASRYRTEILQIFARMFAIREKVLPANRRWVEYYLRLTWDTISELAKSLHSPVTDIPDYAEEKFKEYVQFEEDRIRKNLAGIKYDIDALETVYGVIGPGRIEKHILTLICLMLRRDFELFRLATEVELDNEELWDATDSLIWVLDVVGVRYRELVAQFQQQKVDVDKQMKTISCELFDYYHDSLPFWRLSNVANATEVEPTDEELPSAQLKDLPPNNYPLHPEWPYSCEVYDVVPDQPSEADLKASDVIKPFLGRWNGFIHDDDGYALKTMFTFYAHTAPSEAEHHIEASGMSSSVSFTLRASITQQEATLKIKAVVQYAKDLADRYYAGILQPDGFIIGSQGSEDDESQHTAHFIWTQLPGELMALRPMPPYNVPSKTDDSVVVPNKARALWDYAIQAVLLQNRRTSWSWSYFRQRRDDRQRYLDYCTKQETSNVADPYGAEPMKRNIAFRSMTSVDRDFYSTLWDRFWRIYPDHIAYCDACSTTCRGRRYMCIDCLDNATPEGRYGNSIDFCSLSCAQSTLHPNPKAVKKPHNPSHDILQKRVILQYRDMAHAYRQTKAAIAMCQRIFSRVSKKQVGDDENTTEPSIQVTAADLSKDNTKPPECRICCKAVSMPCWLCVECSQKEGTNSPLICDDCEENSLLDCVTCEKPFKQPSWFYGFYPRDTFMCNMCIAKKVPVKPIGEDKPHTYLHALVRCHVKEEDATERSTDDRVVVVESTVANLDQKVDSLTERLSRLEGYMERIERMLAQTAAPEHSEPAAQS